MGVGEVGGERKEREERRWTGEEVVMGVSREDEEKVNEERESGDQS